MRRILVDYKINGDSLEVTFMELFTDLARNNTITIRRDKIGNKNFEELKNRIASIYSTTDKTLEGQLKGLNQCFTNKDRNNLSLTMKLTSVSSIICLILVCISKLNMASNYQQQIDSLYETINQLEQQPIEEEYQETIEVDLDNTSFIEFYNTVTENSEEKTVFEIDDFGLGMDYCSMLFDAYEISYTRLQMERLLYLLFYGGLSPEAKGELLANEITNTEGVRASIQQLLSQINNEMVFPFSKLGLNDGDAGFLLEIEDLREQVYNRNYSAGTKIVDFIKYLEQYNGGISVGVLCFGEMQLYDLVFRAMSTSVMSVEQNNLCVDLLDKMNLGKRFEDSNSQYSGNFTKQML